MDTALEEADLRLAMERLKTAIVFYLAKGNSVETPLGTFAAHVRGTRNGSPVVPEISRDGMVIRFRPERGMYRAVQTALAISVEEQMDPKRPRISTVMNAEDEGLFFVNETEEEFRTTVYSRHGTSIIDCKIPDLPAGPYTLQLRARPRKGAELRTGAYANIVAVS